MTQVGRKGRVSVRVVWEGGGLKGGILGLVCGGMLLVRGGYVVVMASVGGFGGLWSALVAVATRAEDCCAVRCELEWVSVSGSLY